MNYEVWRCRKCGYEFYTNPDLDEPEICPMCGNKIKEIEFVEKLKEFAEGYACDSIQDMEVVESTDEYAVLKVCGWDGHIFYLKVIDIWEEEVSE